MFSEIAKNIRCLVTKNKLIFGIISISLIISVMTLLYVSVKIEYNAFIEEASELNYTFIGIYNNGESVSSAEETLSAFAERHSGVNYSFMLFQCDKTFELYGRSGSLYLAAFFNKDDLQRYMNDLVFDTGKELTANDLTDISGAVLLSDYSSANEVSMNDIPLTIVGKYSGGYLPSADGIVALESAISADAEPIYYVVQLDKSLTGDTIRKYNDDLSRAFDGAKVINNIDVLSPLEGMIIGMTRENITLLIMAIAAFVNIVFLYMFLIKKRIRQVFVYKLCGATSDKITSILYTEMAIVVLFHVIIAFLVFRFGLFQLIKKYDIAFAYGLSLRHYLISGFGAFLIETVAMRPVFKRYSRMKPVNVKQAE